MSRPNSDDKTDDKQIKTLGPGMYHVPWPHSVLAEGGLHQATKFRRFYLIIGIIMIVLAVVSIVLGFPVISQYKIHDPRIRYSGTGFWGGCMYMVTGIVSLICSKQVKMQCTVLTSFVLAVSTIGVAGYICSYEFHQATAYGYKDVHALSALEGIIGFVGVLAIAAGVALAGVSGSTVCSCSYGDVGVSAARSDGMTLLIN